MGEAAFSLLGEVGRLDQLPGFIVTLFVAQLFLSAAAFPEGRAVMPASPALLLMPFSEERGDLLTQWVGNHWQDILSKMHCATRYLSIPALRAGKSCSTARHSLTGSSRVCLVIINWCFQLLQLHMWKRKRDLWCESVCTGTRRVFKHSLQNERSGTAHLHLLCTCVCLCVCVRGTQGETLLLLGTCLCLWASILKSKFFFVGSVFKRVQLC